MESETERGRGRREGEGKMGVPGVGGTTPAHAPSARACGAGLKEAMPNMPRLDTEKVPPCPLPPAPARGVCVEREGEGDGERGHRGEGAGG